VPARSVYLHPGHNLSVLAYDPALLGDTPVRSAELETRSLAPGDEVHLVALTPSQQLVTETTRVSRVEMPSVPLPSPPRFRETNVELVTVTSTTPNVGGVLTDGKGRVLALWASFSTQQRRRPTSFLAGLPSEVATEVVAPLAAGRKPGWRSPDAELELVPLAEARNRGLSEQGAQRLETHDPERRRVLAVRRVVAGTEAARRLRVGDLVLGVNGAPVTRPRELERAVQEGVPRLHLLRDGRELELDVPTSPLDGAGTERAVVFAGALLQAPHRPLAAQWGIPLEGVYVAWSWLGSPAHRYGLRSTHRILEVDGFPTRDLDAFLARVRGRADRDPVRLETVDLEGRVSVRTLKLDLQHWPQLELRRRTAGWERVPGDVEAPPGGPDESTPRADPGAATPPPASP
jgi:S1-C subfamily serine protease